jgi:hypothetical protein
MTQRRGPERRLAPYDGGYRHLAATRVSGSYSAYCMCPGAGGGRVVRLAGNKVPGR